MHSSFRVNPCVGKDSAHSIQLHPLFLLIQATSRRTMTYCNPVDSQSTFTPRSALAQVVPERLPGLDQQWNDDSRACISHCDLIPQMLHWHRLRYTKQRSNSSVRVSGSPKHIQVVQKNRTGFVRRYCNAFLILCNLCAVVCKS